MMLRTNGWLHAVFSFYPKDFAEIIVKEEKRHKTLRTMIKGEETAGAKVLPHILENGSRWTEEWQLTQIEVGNYNLKYVQRIPKRSESILIARP